jgi:hypothetical protein
MTTFVDGPAAGQRLMLRRGVKYIRAVRNRVTGKWDALDQVEDTPGEAEEIFAYVGKNIGHCHVRASGGGGGIFSIGSYEFIPEQPTDEQMRNHRMWVAWVEEYDRRTKQ